MISYFTNSGHSHPQISLVLSLLANGCNFEHIKKIVKCKENSLQNFVINYYGKSVDTYNHIRKYLSDEQCLHIKWMTAEKKADFYGKFLVKLIYPGFICLLTYSMMLFFKFNLLNRIRSLFELSSNNNIYVYFDVVMYILTISYMFFIIIIMSSIFFLKNPQTRNYFYIYMQTTFKDNLITLYYTGIFSELLLQCFKTGISTQKSLEILGKFSELPIVMFFANNFANQLTQGASFANSVSVIDTDTSFKEFMQLGLFSNKVIEQLSHYCLFNKKLIESKINRSINFFYVFVYVQFLVVSVLLYQVIQIPMSVIGSQI